MAKKTIVFDKEHAQQRDQRFAKLAPLRDALHLFMRMVMSELPEDAHILCVGIGTGPELFYLADAFPKWRFTALEPAAPMLDVCRHRAKEAGIEARCTFHEGYLNTLPKGELYDAATCILVSHFITNVQERGDFFAEVAERLRPQGLLLNAELSGDLESLNTQRLLKVWLRTLEYTGMPEEEKQKMIASFGTKVALLPPQEIEKLLEESGFLQPVLFFQSLLIHAWFSKNAT